MDVLATLILPSTIVFAVPLLLVALGGMFSERSGIINIALEGIMIVGALFACLTLRTLDAQGWGGTHPQLAVLIAIFVAGITGAVYSLLLALAAIHLQADQTIGGTALNTIAPAFAIVLTWAIQGQGNTSIIIPKWVRMSSAAADSGILQSIFMKEFILTTPVSLVLLILSIIILYKTRFGLRLRACGEHPQAADSVGINVYKMRYAGVIISGFLAGIGGLAFSVAAGSAFTSTVAGYGFLALAVMIFGNWQPVKIFGASLFFAFFKVISFASSSIPFLPSFPNIKNAQYIYQMLPYIVTMIVLIFTSKKSQAPKAEGIPYDKGSR